MISGRIKEGCGAGAGSSLPASPRRPRPCRGVFWAGSLPPSLPGRGDGCRLAAPRPPPCSGLRVPQASGLPGARSGGGGGGDDPVQHSSRGVASFLRPGEAPPPRWSPRPGLPVPGPGRVPCRCPPRSRGTARLEHQCFGIPAKSRASELSILIEIAGLGTAGGCLYRFDFCCSGKHITND